MKFRESLFILVLIIAGAFVVSCPLFLLALEIHGKNNIPLIRNHLESLNYKVIGIKPVFENFNATIENKAGQLQTIKLDSRGNIIGVINME